MKPHLLTALLLVVSAHCGAVAQKGTPPPPPSGSSGTITPTPVPSPPVDYSGLQRQIDEERMNTPEPRASPVAMVELEKTLADNRRSGDGRLAAILAKLTLTERTNAARLARWNAEFKGTETRQALMALADGSAFLPLPAEDIPMEPAPSVVEQRRMITAFGKFLSETLPKLPNLRATRLTRNFEDRPPRQLALSTDPDGGDPLGNRPMHLVGTSKLRVAYVEGHEVEEKSSGFEDANLKAARFTTAGEFGPILYGVMMDAVRIRLAWARWESSENGPLAVFGFDAPKEKSHYSIKPAGAAKAENQFVAYRGEIAVHPADGTIERLSVIARPATDDDMVEANIAVEYGLVEIGERSYTCPVHGVALSKIPLVAAHGAKQEQPVPLQTKLNDVSFQQYQIYRGDLRITPGATTQP